MEDEMQEVLGAWETLVSGSSSLIEWFDTETRRFILVRPNPPGVYDTRRLTKQERDVAGYAALGETNKLIAYRLGISSGRVSTVLCSALRKLGFRTRAQLVYCVRGLGLPISFHDLARHEPRSRRSA
jgi:DNA-binding NarL/FixJ family response regulator